MSKILDKNTDTYVNKFKVLCLLYNYGKLDNDRTDTISAYINNNISKFIPNWRESEIYEGFGGAIIIYYHTHDNKAGNIYIDTIGIDIIKITVAWRDDVMHKFTMTQKHFIRYLFKKLPFDSKHLERYTEYINRKEINTHAN